MNVNNCSDISLLQRYALLLEVEIGAAHRRIKELADEVARLRGDTNANMELELKLLEEKLERREKALFGETSERRPDESSSETKADSEQNRPKQQGHGPRQQPALPTVDLVHHLDPADMTCPDCGGTLSEWSGQHETAEEIDVIERTYRVVRHQRQKYHCSCGHIETAEPPTKLIPGGRYSLDFAIDVAVGKYADHLPLNRQVSQMARQGLNTDTQTLWDQIKALSDLVRPSYNALIDHVLSAPVIGIDETKWRLLGGGKTENRTRSWWVWAVTGHNAVYYHLLPSRDTDAARQVIRTYQGIVVADGYAVYEALARAGPSLFGDGPAIVLSQCWAHARRKLIEAEQHYPQAAEGIELIGQIYAVEREVQQADLSSEEDREALRGQLRQERSAPLLAQLHQWLLEQRALPRSSFGKALAYIGKRWTGLKLFLTDPRIPLDNNATERAIRGPVVGRKNHYGSRSQAGTEVAAVFYSLIESTKLAGVNPVQYLRTAAQLALADPKAVLLPHELASGGEPAV